MLLVKCLQVQGTRNASHGSAEGGSTRAALTCGCAGARDGRGGQRGVLDGPARVLGGQGAGGGGDAQGLRQGRGFSQDLAPCKGSRGILNLNLRHGRFPPEPVTVGKQL